MSCVTVERTGTLTLTFDVCSEHEEARPKSGFLELAGIPLMDATRMTLSVLEEAIARTAGDYPPLKKIIETDWPDGGPLPERAQAHLARLLAHQLILSEVASRDYFVPGVSASMELPL